MSASTELAPSPDVAAQIAAVESKATVFTTLQGGARMIWRRWGAGSPVLLLHGGSGSWKHWIRNVAALSAEHTVWVPDLPGFGESGLPEEPLSLESVAAQVTGGWRELSPNAPFVDVAGFSLGATFAVQIAHQYPGLVHHLALIGCNFVGAPLLEIPGMRGLRGVDGAAERNAVYRNNLRALMLARDERVDDLALFVYALDAARRRAPGNAFRGSGAVRRLLPGARITGSVLGIWGTADATLATAAPLQRGALAELRPDASYLEITEGGHWVMYEEPERVDHALKSVFAV